MGLDDINVQRVLDAVKNSVLAACMKVPKAPSPDFDEIKNRVQRNLFHMEQKGLISASDVKIIEDTPAEKLVREIMEEEEDTVRTEIEMRAVFPVTYLKMDFKIKPDS